MQGNLLNKLPDKLPQELTETLLENRQLRIERIVSTGHASPDGFWYDQAEHEWVAVLKGEAMLRFEDQADLVPLRPGDWINIPAHQRHRVEWTSPETPTVWLAVFYRSDP